MKRDLDLARHLLLDIENRGADCSVSALRVAPHVEQSEVDNEKIRHHLRLLIDAGLLQEVDRTSAGIPCVRLTHQGHELLELARHETAWQEAKQACQDRLGGLSLRVIQNILWHWAIDDAPRYVRRRRPVATRRLRYADALPPVEADATYRERPVYRVEPVRERWEDQELEPGENVRYVRVAAEGSDYRPGADYRLHAWRGGVDLDGDGHVDIEYASHRPTYVL